MLLDHDGRYHTKHPVGRLGVGQYVAVEGPGPRHTVIILSQKIILFKAANYIPLTGL
jgi:hypothetical protein